MSKTKFTAISPWTGAALTRSSLRAYTHAVVYHTTVDALRAGIEARKATLQAEAAEYAEIADLLERGVEPPAGAPILTRRTGTSYAEEKAGVRSVWDRVCYELRGNSVYGQVSAADLAKRYRMYEASVLTRAAGLDPAKVTEPREDATFHHSAALAHKAAISHGSPMTAIVEVR